MFFVSLWFVGQTKCEERCVEEEREKGEEKGCGGEGREGKEDIWRLSGICVLVLLDSLD